jgi:hypothetical protein
MKNENQAPVSVVWLVRRIHLLADFPISLTFRRERAWPIPLWPIPLGQSPYEQSQDIRRIEHTLDGLLDFCFDPEVLLLYKKLCRHYYAIDPAATGDYV